jgi:hypothetical protein
MATMFTRCGVTVRASLGPREIWREWFHRYGRARIEPVNSRDDVADYCAKYVTKEDSWWDVKLLSHRRAEDSTDFELSSE